MPHGHNSNLPAGAPRERTTRAKSMAAFDALPREIRDLVNYAPVKIATPSLLATPARQRERNVVRTVQKWFPEWTPTPRDPECAWSMAAPQIDLD